MMREDDGQAIPWSDGCIQLQWSAGGIDVEIVITPEGTFQLE